MPQNLTAEYQPAANEYATTGMEDRELLEAAEETGSRYAEARRKLKEHWAVAKEDLSHFKQQAYDYSQSAAKATDAYAHDHPWRTASAAIGFGALLGWLISRR